MDENRPDEASESAADLSNGDEQASGTNNGRASAAQSPVPTDEAFLDDADTGDDESSILPPSALRIRGRPGGVSIEVGEGAWDELLVELEERLETAEGFFRGGRVVLEVGSRAMVEDDLRRARILLAGHDMTLSIVRSTTERTLQAAAQLGLSTSDVEVSPVVPEREMRAVVPITQPKSPYFVHHGTLRSGQVLRKSESVVVLGDVNPGAQIISAGDVMVWGRLRGVAHAGVGGSQSAVVAAIEFTPTQLRIAGVTAIAPDTQKPTRGFWIWKKEPERRPEVAYISDGRIVVEPWDDSRLGRPKALRR